MKLKLRRYPFYISLTTLVISLILTLTTLLLWDVYRESRKEAIASASTLFTEINSKNMERYEYSLEAVTVIAGAAARMQSLAVPPTGDGLSYPGLDFMFETLEFYHFLLSLYIGYENDEFLQVVAVRNIDEHRKIFKAPEGTYFVVRSISMVGGAREQS